MDTKTEKMIDSVILESKLFQQQHKPAAPRDKVADFLSFAKRKFSELADYFLTDTGTLPKIDRGKRDFPRPKNMQIR